MSPPYWCPESFGKVSLTLIGHFPLDHLRKSLHPDYLSLVQPTSDEFARIARFKLKRHAPALDMNDTSQTGDGLAGWRRRGVAQIDFDPHGILIRFQKGNQGFPSGSFQKSYQRRRTQHRRHTALGEVNGVPRLDDKLLFPDRSNSWRTFHTPTIPDRSFIAPSI